MRLWRHCRQANFVGLLCLLALRGSDRGVSRSSLRPALGWRISLGQLQGRTETECQPSGIGFLFMDDDLTYIDVELRESSMISKSFALPLDESHRRIRKSSPNRPTHNAHSLDMLHKLRKGSKQQSHIGQSTCSHHPCRSHSLFHQSMSHCQHGIRPPHSLSRWSRQATGAIQSSKAYTNLSKVPLSLCSNVP